MTTAQYISRLNTLYHTGTAIEHSYRGDLQNLIMDLLPDILVTNEPAKGFGGDYFNTSTFVGP